MEHSEMFLLLPKYEEAEGQPDYLNAKSIMTEHDILKVIDNIDEICTFIAYENYEGYYDAKNISAFLYPAQVAEDCYPNILTRMRIVMNKWGENWRTSAIQKDTENYMYYSFPIKDDTLCEMIERKAAATDDSTFLLVNQDAFPCSTPTIKTKRNQEEVELDVKTADIKSVSKWYETNRKPQRRFHLSPKHGENGKGAHPDNKGEKVSVLMCSRDEAEDMLLKAMGTEPRTLFFFDAVHQQYIEFKRESDHVYHGFHLDATDEKRVPEHIKLMISKLT